MAKSGKEKEKYNELKNIVDTLSNRCPAAGQNIVKEPNITEKNQ